MAGVAEENLALEYKVEDVMEDMLEETDEEDDWSGGLLQIVLG